MNIHSSIQGARIDTPFGPKIFGMQLPENIFQKLVKLADDVWERKNHISWNHELVGHMKYQYYVPHSQLKEYELFDFFIEKNRPATFKYPFYSFLGDLKMFSELLLRKRKFEE